MPVTNTIMPAGGGDYTTLQAWESAVDGLSADTYIAECHEGGNLGQVTFTAITSGSVLIAQVASGQEHNGSISDGAYVTVASANPIAITNASVQLKGLRVERTGSNGSIVNMSLTIGSFSCMIDGCFIHAATGLNGSINGSSLGGDGLTETLNVRNNIYVRAFAQFSQTYIGDGTSTVVLNYFNNTQNGGSGVVNGLQLSRTQIVGSGTANFTATVRNNVGFSNTGSDFVSSANSGNGTLSITSSNNASEDSTADWAGGSGHVEGIVPADEFVNPESDWALLSAASCYEAGFDLSGTFTNDAYSNTRETPWNIGAWGGMHEEPPSGGSAKSMLLTKVG